METQVHALASLALIDQKLDELKEDFGDLPEKLKEINKKVDNAKALVDETQNIIEEIKNFCATSKITLIELKEKEEKLSKQQFLVRNNKEFDAMTNEIENIRKEHESLSDKLRSEGIKEENILPILEEQKAQYEEVLKQQAETNQELENLSNDQNEELNVLTAKHDEIVKHLKPEILIEYKRVRGYHQDAAVRVRKNSCSGCYSSVPPQIIVEVRNNYDKVFFCENCGRILYPEEIVIDSEIMDLVL